MSTAEKIFDIIIFLTIRIGFFLIQIFKKSEKKHTPSFKPNFNTEKKEKV